MGQWLSQLRGTQRWLKRIRRKGNLLSKTEYARNETIRGSRNNIFLGGLHDGYASLFHMPRGPYGVTDYGLALYTSRGECIEAEGTDYQVASKYTSARHFLNTGQSNNARIDLSVGICFDRWIGNYYHWMIYCVPKIILLRDCFDVVHYLMPSDLGPIPHFVWQTLDLLGLSDSSLIPVQRGLHQASELCFVDGAVPSPLTCQLTRRRLMQIVSVSIPSPQRKVFLRRKSQVHAQRALVNEAEVLDLCAAQGIEVVDPGELPLEEQIELFQQASVVIAVHGAALVNILWMQPGATVIEIATGTQPHYKTLAEHLGITWMSLLARKVDQQRSGHNGSFYVNATIVKTMIESYT